MNKQFSIKTKTTDEANISKRHIWYEFYIDGEFMTTRNDILEAMALKAELEAQGYEYQN